MDRLRGENRGGDNVGYVSRMPASVAKSNLFRQCSGALRPAPRLRGGIEGNLRTSQIRRQLGGYCRNSGMVVPEQGTTTVRRGDDLMLPPRGLWLYAR